MTKHDIDTEDDNKCMVSIGLKVNKDQDMKTVNMGQNKCVGPNDQCELIDVNPNSLLTILSL